MELRPQDVVVALKLAVLPEAEQPTYAGMAAALEMSSSEVHSAVKRAKAARLVVDLDGRLRADRRCLLEFLIHGVKYAFPAVRGGLTRGVPTSVAAPPLNGEFASGGEPPPVWPDAAGKMRGLEFSPLARNAPKAAKRDQELYELLALVDAIREGRARERQMAVKELTARLKRRRRR
ncbi:MAG: hypothetical protein HZB13_02470 [Acidobacteria bacterium]|nr:hypothetical protein [Acidobacteriota bacterium]